MAQAYQAPSPASPTASYSSYISHSPPPSLTSKLCLSWSAPPEASSGALMQPGLGHRQLGREAEAPP